eukprot:CAMPEP_0116851462 /NCGR_PEP_ID=MMETSP0418-20121206/16741_1 /TAXON_ID=1158023 /ORGANISM="Astrosyne radiata, Strain 13vi08-1A" /LENGTH=39 /DNA_ID= /DNA_START= /DNA_END= /DNA_ORIENTATION=
MPDQATNQNEGNELDSKEYIGPQPQSPFGSCHYPNNNPR